MLPITRSFAIVVCAMALPACSRSTESNLLGEWTRSNSDIPSRVIYSADHTYSGWLNDPRDGMFKGAGTWQLQGNQMICRDFQHGESKADLLKVTRSELKIKRPDGIISTYKRTK
jgi:hypothetical protein